jgi:8-oxo-dGTP pyrophosphatase MutT (NUDIX family)
MNRALINNEDASNHRIENQDDLSWLQWETRSRQTLLNCKVFAVNTSLATSKGQPKKTGQFYTLSCGPWVNVIALTPSNEVVMVEQYRHGVEALTLEIPGGSVDLADDDPVAAAMRELKEETGFISERWSFLGKNHPNPALQDNFCYTFLAEEARQIEAPQFDDSGTEKINTRYVKLDDIASLIRDGGITHALVITAFHFLSLNRTDIVQAASSR